MQSASGGRIGGELYEAFQLIIVVIVPHLAACAENGGSPNPATATPPSANGGEEVTDGEDGLPVYVPPSYELPDKETDVYREKDGKRHIIIGVAFDMYYDSTHQSISDNPSVSNPEIAQLMLDKVRELE